HRKLLSTDRRVAERMLADLIRERDLALSGLGGEIGQDRSLSEIKGEYLADLKGRVSATHYDGVSSRLARIIEGLGARTVRRVQADAVVRFRSQRLRDGAANRTANFEVGALKGMFNWAVQTGLVHHNPLLSLKRLPEGDAYQRYWRRALTEDEIARFLKAA